MINEKLERLKVALTRRASPPGMPIGELREHFEAGVAAMPSPADVALDPVDAGGVPGMWFTPPDPAPGRAVLYLHGGGYIMGSSRTVRPLAAHLAQAAGVRLLALDYRLAPEHPCPAAIHDTVDAYRWLLAEGYDPGQLAFGGDSAGGGL